MADFNGAAAPGNPAGQLNCAEPKDVVAIWLFGNVTQANPGEQQPVGRCFRKLREVHDLRQGQAERMVGEKFKYGYGFIEDLGAGCGGDLFHTVDPVPLDGRKCGWQMNESNMKIQLQAEYRFLQGETPV